MSQIAASFSKNPEELYPHFNKMCRESLQSSWIVKVIAVVFSWEFWNFKLGAGSSYHTNNLWEYNNDSNSVIYSKDDTFLW